MTSRVFGGAAAFAEVRALLGAALLFMGTGCAGAAMRSSVATHFAGAFQCERAAVHGVAGGFRVHGCGRSAVYQCARHRYDHDEGLLHNMLDSALIPRDCTLVHMEKRRQRPPVAALRRYVHGKFGVVLEASVRTPSVQITAVGLPEHSPDFVWLRVQRMRGAFGLHASRDMRFLRDGEVQVMQERQRVDEHQLVGAVPATAVRGVHRALKLSLVVDGLQIQLDARARKLLAELEVELRERHALHEIQRRNRRAMRDLAGAAAAP